MSDCSPLRLAETDQSSPSQSLGSHNSQTSQHIRSRVENVSQQSTSNAAISQDQEYSVRIRTYSDASSSKSGQLRYGARNVIELFVPVSICMLIVVGTLKATDSYHYSSQTVIWYAQMMFTDQSVDTGTRVWQSFANAFIMLVFIVIMTTVLILLYKFRCYATIHGWLILSSLLLLFMFAIMYIAQILKVYNIPMDIYTLSVIIWNFGVVGMICIHWKGPLLLQQAYLITISAFLALVFIRCLPDWTVWTVLAIVSVWDLVAVLCPCGPLRILVETAQERNEPIFPALIYSSTMMWEVVSILHATTVASTMIPIISMADSQQSSQESKKSSNKQKIDSRRHQGTSAAPSRRTNRHNPSGLDKQTKRNQHPVEIQYEDGSDPPEVGFVQPVIEPIRVLDEVWQRPTVRALNSTAPPQDSSQPTSRIVSTRVSRNTVSSTQPGEIGVNNNQRHARVESQTEEERGVKLGLGDFIFFSVLVGKASSYGDWTITMSCFVAILVGLCLTLSLLAVFRKALPALPISIAFGLSSFFLSYLFVVPFAEKLTLNQVFI